MLFWNPFRNLENRLMAGLTELRESVNELNATIATEQEQVAAAVQGLAEKVADLTEALEGLTDIDLSAEVAAVNEAIAAVKAIYEPATAVEVVEPVVESEA